MPTRVIISTAYVSHAHGRVLQAIRVQIHFFNSPSLFFSATITVYAALPTPTAAAAAATTSWITAARPMRFGGVGSVLS
jgi:hypothetical protein